MYTVRAGKFRRYHQEGLKQLFDLPTISKNIRDFFFVIIGLLQSYILMNKIKPDLVFSRGGYVSVPVCIAAKLNSVKYITHDSDPIPSLTNKIIGKWASLHLVSAPKDTYPYKKDKIIVTGIPVSTNFKPLNLSLRKQYRKEININEKSKMLFIIGGGLGAQSLNRAVIEIMPNLMSEFKDLEVVHIVGKSNEKQNIKDYDKTLTEKQKQRIKIISFTDKVYLYSGAADIVITRAGATNLAEFAIQGVPCIIVPSTFLVAGHQLKNAQILSDNNAAIVIKDKEVDDDPYLLAKEVRNLLNNNSERQRLATEISKFGYPNASKKIAAILIKEAENKK